MKSFLKNLVNKSFGYFGYELVRTHFGDLRLYNFPSCIERLAHASKIGFSPKVIIDGGAFKGFWSCDVKKIFPEAQLVVIEPNTFLLDAIKENLDGFDPPAIVESTAIGEKKGDVVLNIWQEVDNDQGASLLDHVRGEAEQTIEVSVNTLDKIAAEHGLAPDLVKLDLQGAEMQALRGATRLLKETELFIIEFGCLEAYKNRTTPREVMDMMYDNGYCLYDIVDFNYRPYDGALTGGDFFFVKKWSELRKYKAYE